MEKIRIVETFKLYYNEPKTDTNSILWKQKHVDTINTIDTINTEDGSWMFKYCVIDTQTSARI